MRREHINNRRRRTSVLALGTYLALTLAGGCLTLVISQWPDAFLLVAIVIIPIEVAHTIAPIGMAWADRDLRAIMLSRPLAFILLPSGLFAAALAIGLATSLGCTSFRPVPGNLWRLTDLGNPYPAVAWLFFWWNAYHFGAQLFGVGRLCGCKHLPKWLCASGMLGFFVAGKFWSLPMLAAFALGAVSLNHWLTELVLCYRVSRLPWFLVAVLAIGCVGFLWKVPLASGNVVRIDLGWAIPTFLCAWFGAGFVHFLYDRWLWRLSDPVVGPLMRSRIVLHGS